MSARRRCIPLQWRNAPVRDASDIGTTSEKLPVPASPQELYDKFTNGTYYFLVNIYTGTFSQSSRDLGELKSMKTRNCNDDWSLSTQDHAGDNIIVPFPEEAWKIYSIDPNNGTFREVPYRSKTQEYP